MIELMKTNTQKREQNVTIIIHTECATHAFAATKYA